MSLRTLSLNSSNHQSLAGLLGSMALIGMLACGSSNSDNPTPTPTPRPILPAITRVTSLSGANETPAVTSTAAGTGSFTVDPNTLAITGTVITTGLAGTAAHIHEAAAGTAGSVIIPLTSMQGGVWTVPAGTVLTTSQLASFQAGNFYANVHSAANPGGEIRGQIVWQVKFANLEGAQETPAVTTTATGLGSLAVNPLTMDAAGGIRLTGVTATGAHVHEAAAGTAGSVIIGMTDGGSGSWTLPGTAALTAGQLGSFNSNSLYMNAHSAANPGGEVRGQLSIVTPIIKTITLSGTNEVPANASTATATATVAVDPVTREVRGTMVSTGMTVTGAHIHQAATGVNGSVIVPFTDAGGGVWVVASGRYLTGPQFMDFVNGNLYVNMHSAAFPAGEIRGQLPATTLASSVGAGDNGGGGDGGGGGGGY